MRADPAPLIGLAWLAQFNALLCIVTAGCQAVLSRALGLGALFVKGLRVHAATIFFCLAAGYPNGSQFLGRAKNG